jgi:hypothetical protein
MNEALKGILRAVRQQTVAKMATGFELGMLLSQNELQGSACQGALAERQSAATRW